MKQEEFSTPFHFSTLEDQTAGIETAVYPNGHIVKRLGLSDGKTAIIRELNGGDMMQIDKMIGADNTIDPILATMHYSVKIDGKQITMEDFKNLKGKDYNKIKVPALSLNF